MKNKETLVAVTCWLPKSLKEAANEVAQRRGDLTRMIETGLRKEVAIRQLEISQREQEPKAS
jgi:hypothetical protein